MANTESEFTVNGIDMKAKVLKGNIGELGKVEIHPTKTLKSIHSKLKIKQSLKIYTANTNKKYHLNLEPTQVIDSDLYELIYFNTLGKLRRHAQQMNYIQHNKKLSVKNEQLKLDLSQAEKRNKQAMAIADKDNLKNAYIECLEVYQAWNSFSADKKQVIDYLTKIGIKYAGYMKPEGISKIFSDRIEWFKKEIKK